MRRLKITVKFESPYLTPLHSDTLFGEFCWAFRFLFGEGRLRKALESEGFVVFSDFLPEGKLPVPKKVPFLSFNSYEDYARVKRIKKVKFIDLTLFNSLLAESSSLDEFIDSLFVALRKLIKEEERKKGGERRRNSFKRDKNSIVTHVSINRLTGTAYESKLFYLKEIFAAGNYDIYCLYDEDFITEEELLKTLAFLGLNGFGAKKSSGKGKFKIICYSDSWGLVERGNSWFVSLSTGLPKSSEISDLYADFFTSFPKHGREVASSSIFKDPLVQAVPGSLFKAKEKRDFYGSLVENSHHPGHKHSRLILSVFVG
ncbi:type III-A CRISPR-associated RAMP protein Csm4 [Thermovibrio sp.]